MSLCIHLSLCLNNMNLLTETSALWCALCHFFVIPSRTCLVRVLYWICWCSNNPLMHSLCLPCADVNRIISGRVRVSLNHSCSCLSQGPGSLFSDPRTSRRVPKSVLFTPKHSLKASHSGAKKKKSTLHHKSRMEHGEVTQTSRSHAHESDVICASDLQARTPRIISLNHTHTWTVTWRNSRPDTYGKYNKYLLIYQ